MAQKRYEILASLPVYGTMYIPITFNGIPSYSEGFPVRFYKTDGTEWVANFQEGWTKLKQIVALEDTSNVLVIAGGICYLMDPDITEPIQVFGAGCCNIFKADNHRLVLQDNSCLTIVEPDGEHWSTERISWDDLTDITVKDNIVSGFAYDPLNKFKEWVEFSYNLDTKILTGGSYPQGEL